MAKHLAHAIDALKQELLGLGALVERAIARGITALVTRDGRMAEQVIAEDADIDRMEVRVEEECLKVLALYQPVAIDLRFVVSALKMNNDLERMGDLAKNIAKRARFLASVEPINLPIDFRTMASRAQTMVKHSLDALVNSDTSLARQVRLDDEELDAMRSSIHRTVYAAIRDDPSRTETLLKLYSVAKHLERLGDLATNVAEDVIYMVEGDIVRHQHREDD